MSTAASFILPPLSEIAIGAEGGMHWAAELRGGRVWGVHWQDTRAPDPTGGLWRVRVRRLAPDRRGAIVSLGGQDGEGFLDLSSVKSTPHEGQALVAQVTRAAGSGKRLTLSPEPRLAGRYIVYSPERPGVAVSRQWRDKASAARWQAIARGMATPDEGIVVRAAAQILADEAVLASELARLRQAWASALAKPEPGQVLPPPGLVQTLLTERAGTAPLTFSTDEPLLEPLLRGAIGELTPAEDIRMTRERGGWRIRCGAAEAFDCAAVSEVPLDGGGRIWLERTRACWTVDVDSAGSASDRQSLNCAAAIELGRQLRIRNASGPIVADFLRLPDRQSQAVVINALRAAFAEDRAHVRFNERFDPLGLYTFSRQRIGPELPVMEWS